MSTECFLQCLALRYEVLKAWRNSARCFLLLSPLQTVKRARPPPPLATVVCWPVSSNAIETVLRMLTHPQDVATVSPSESGRKVRFSWAVVDAVAADG